MGNAATPPDSPFRTELPRYSRNHLSALRKRDIVKKIEAIIRTEKLEDVKAALHDAGVRGLTVSQVTGRGQQRTRVFSGRASIGVETDMLQRLKIEVFVSAEQADTACEVIGTSAATGNVGDGKIFVLPVEGAIRIRTGEQDDAAI